MRDSNLTCTNLHRCALIFIGFTSVLLYAPLSSATADFNAAGVLIVARENGLAHILLGRDRFRPWYEMLAGSRESVPGESGGGVSRRETAYETALRECFEESRGFFKPDYLLGVTDSSKFIRDGSFVFFHAETDKFSVEQIRRAPIPDGVDAAPFNELVDFTWVSVEAILSSIDAFVLDDTGRRIQVRRQLKPRLRRAREAGWL